MMSVMTTLMSSEPRQPVWLLKNKNIGCAFLGKGADETLI